MDIPKVEGSYAFKDGFKMGYMRAKEEGEKGMKELNWKKPLRTKSGKMVDEVSVSGCSKDCKVVIFETDEREFYTLDGRIILCNSSGDEVRHSSTEWDLENVPEPKVYDYYLKLYTDGCVIGRPNVEDLEEDAEVDSFLMKGTFHLRYTEGKGAEIVEDEKPKKVSKRKCN